MTKSKKLDSLIERARNHKMTPEQKRKQRISLVMGLRSNNSTLTKEKVETILEGAD